VTLADDVLRSDDRLYRYGGEEFAIILPNTGLSGACRTAQRLIEHLRASSIRHVGRLVPVTCSAGIAGLEAVGDDRPTLVARADAALYEAKRAGRDRVHMRRYLAAVNQSRPV
jgi:diguanylate cyclase (GGDEF)-like protein